MFTAANTVAFRYHQKDRFSGHLLTLCLLYLGQVTVTVLFLGTVVRSLGAVPLFVLNSALSILVILIYRRYVGESLFHFYRRSRDFFKDIFGLKDIFLYLLLFLFLLQVLVLLIKISYFPPQVWDSFAYHIPPIADWLQRDMISPWIDSPVSRMNRNPLGSKLFHFWVVRFFGDITWIELPQFFYGLLIMLTAYAVMIKMAIKRAIALRYALLIYFIPLILIGSRTCQDHVVLTGATMMALYYFLNLFYSPTQPLPHHPRTAQLIFFGIAVGILLGIKISSPQNIVLLVAALFLSKGFSFPAVAQFLRSHRWYIPATGAITFLLGGYWYFRNYTVTKLYASRIGPYLSDYGFHLALGAAALSLIALAFFLIKKRIPKGGAYIPVKHRKKAITALSLVVLIFLGGLLFTNHAAVKNVISKYRQVEPKITGPHYQKHYPHLKNHDGFMFKNLLVFPFRIKDIGNYTAYAPDFLKQSGFGIQFFVFGLLAFLIMVPLVILKPAYRRGISGFLIFYAFLLLLTYFTYYFSHANYRMFMFFPVIGLILWAFFVQRLELRKPFRIYIDLLLVGMLVFNTAACLFEGNLDIYPLKTLLTTQDPLERTSAKFTPLLKGPDWRFIDTHLSPGDPIGYLGHYDSWISPYYDNRMIRPVYHLRRFPGFSLRPVKGNRLQLHFPPSFKRQLKKKRIHYIHVNPQGIRMNSEDSRQIVIKCPNVVQVTTNLYYFKW